MPTHLAFGNNEHPDESLLKKFALGQLGDQELDAVARHLEGCELCVGRLEQITQYDDSLLESLKTASSSADRLFEVTTPSTDGLESIQNAIESLGKYRVLEQLGAGGMGSVFLAEHTVMDRQVAIKVIRKEFVANPQAVLRFRNEVKHAAKLSHRNIVTAHDAEQINDFHVLVMEHVPGESLSQLVERKGPLSVKHACNFILQVAHGLNHAHENQMVHRDIKPANLMRTPRGVIKILDFGLARVNQVDDHDDITVTGVMMGTADYIAPEQARDAKKADIRSDLYSLGCTFYFLLTGRAPFSGETKVDKIMAHCSSNFPSASQDRLDVPSEILQIIDRLTAKNPSDRFQTPRELIDVLAPFGKPQKGDTVVSPSKPLLENEKSAIRETVGFEDATPTKVIQKLAPDRSGSVPVVGRLKPVLLAGGALLMLVPLVWMLMATLIQELDPDVPPGKTGIEPKRPHVLLVMSAESFWYSDFEPVSRILKEKHVRLTVTAERSGIARFNPSGLDTATGKRNVEIDQPVAQLVNENVANDVDAVVFIGTETGPFRDGGATSQSIERLLNSLRQQKKWIASIGKGSEVPIIHGLYDGVKVCDSEYLIAQARNSSAELVAQNLSEDSDSKVLTAAMWDDAEAFAERLSEILERQ